MPFFEYFPVVPYRVGDVKLDIVQLTAHIRIAETLEQHVTVLYDYIIQDGDRPDIVATKVYGSPDFTWILLVINKIFSLYDWPLTQNEFNDYIEEKYGSLAAAHTSYVYKNAAGYYVDAETWDDLEADERQDPISNYDEEQEANERKRRIKLVPASMAGPLAIELKNVLSS